MEGKVEFYDYRLWKHLVQTFNCLFFKEKWNDYIPIMH